MGDKGRKSQPGSGNEEGVYMDYLFELGWVGEKSSHGAQGMICAWMRFQATERSKWMADFEKWDGSN